MKTLLLTLCLLSTAVLAQSPFASSRIRTINSGQQAPGVEPAFDENYLVTVTVTENDKLLTELVIATARAEFKADCFEPTLNFFGTLAPLDDGTVLVSYALGAEIAVPVVTQQSVNAQGEGVKSTSVQYKTQSAQAQVRLRLGEALNVLKTGNRVYRLTVAKLPVAAAKAQ